MQLAQIGECLVHPAGGIGLDQAHRLGNGEVAADRGEQMQVIGHPASRQELTPARSRMLRCTHTTAAERPPDQCGSSFVLKIRWMLRLANDCGMTVPVLPPSGGFCAILYTRADALAIGLRPSGLNAVGVR